MTPVTPCAGVAGGAGKRACVQRILRATHRAVPPPPCCTAHLRRRRSGAHHTHTCAASRMPAFHLSAAQARWACPAPPPPTIPNVYAMPSTMQVCSLLLVCWVPTPLAFRPLHHAHLAALAPHVLQRQTLRPCTPNPKPWMLTHKPLAISHQPPTWQPLSRTFSSSGSSSAVSARRLGRSRRCTRARQYSWSTWDWSCGRTTARRYMYS